MQNGRHAEPRLSHVEFRLLSLLADGPRSFPEIGRGFDEKVSRDRLRTAASRLELRKLVERIPFTERIEHARGRGGMVPQNVTAFALTADGLGEALQSFNFYRSAGERLATAKILSPRAGRRAVTATRERGRVLAPRDKASRPPTPEEWKRILAVAPPEFKRFLRATKWLRRGEIEHLTFDDYLPKSATVPLSWGPRAGSRLAVADGEMRDFFNEAHEEHLGGRVFGTVEGKEFGSATLAAEARRLRGLQNGSAVHFQFFDRRGGAPAPSARDVRLMRRHPRCFFRACQSAPSGVHWHAIARLKWPMVNLAEGTVLLRAGEDPAKASRKFLEQVQEAARIRGAVALIATPDRRPWNAANVNAAFARLRRPAKIGEEVVLQGSGRRAPEPSTIAASLPSPIVAETATGHSRLLEDGTLYVGGDMHNPTDPKPTRAMREMLLLLIRSNHRLTYDEIGAEKGRRVLLRIRSLYPQCLDWPKKKGDGWAVQ